MKKLRVGVLMGGMSIEREASFNSGRTICDHLDIQRYDIIPLFQKKEGSLFILPWHFLHRGKIADFEHRLVQEAKLVCWDDLKKYIDFMYIALHGRYAEDGCLQGFLEVLGIPYLGSGVLTSAVRMNKTMQKAMLAACDIPVPKGITIMPQYIERYEQYQDVILQQLIRQSISFPCIVKPEHEGSSLGVSLAQTPEQLEQALKHACFINERKPQAVIIEERVTGMEFTCMILTKADGSLLLLPPTEIIAQGKYGIFDYEQKYMPGRAIEYTPARCNFDLQERIKAICQRAMQVLDITTIARIDGFLTDDGNVVILECNTLSGMDPASFLFRAAACIGMSHTAVINHLIETELYRTGLDITMIKTMEHEQAIEHKIRVGVLLGGNTNEREISLVSGRNVCYKLSPHRYEVVPIFVSHAMDLFVIPQELLVRNSTREIEELVNSEMYVKWSDLPQIADFVFIALHGGLGENGSVQGTLEMLGMPYNGSSVLASALCMDKYKMNAFLKNQGFNVPQNYFISKEAWDINRSEILQSILNTIETPFIVKPHDDGCSVMVTKANSKEQLIKAIEEIFASDKTGVLVEQYITGMELTVGVIGNEEPKALVPSQVIRSSDILSIEEKFLPGAGENQTPAQLPALAIAFVQRMVEAAYRAVGCVGYARIDCFYQTAQESITGKEELVFIEFNSLPGLTPATCIFHQAAECGMRPMEFIDAIIRLGFAQHASAHKALEEEQMVTESEYMQSAEI